MPLHPETGTQQTQAERGKINCQVDRDRGNQSLLCLPRGGMLFFALVVVDVVAAGCRVHIYIYKYNYSPPVTSLTLA